MKEYALGFAFSEDLSKVVLIRKLRPEWQFGKLNGVGGKIEKGERPIIAMAREFFEETGCKPHVWYKLGVMSFPEACVYCFCTTIPKLTEVHTQTDEQVGVYDATRMRMLAELEEIIPNLAWLVPMAQWKLTGNQWFGETFSMSMKEDGDGSP